MARPSGLFLVLLGGVRAALDAFGCVAEVVEVWPLGLEVLLDVLRLKDLFTFHFFMWKTGWFLEV